MRSRFPLFLATIFLLPAVSSGQSKPSDSQTLQQLLTEVRALRQELRASLTKVQEAQVLIVRLQTQERAVEHASQTLDDAQTKLTDAQTWRAKISENIAMTQDALNAADEKQKPEQQQVLDFLNEQLEDAKNKESQRQTAEVDAEQQLRTEQDKLDNLQSKFDEIVKELDSAGGLPGPATH